MSYDKSANFTPSLFIGIGATSAFFTLRETYLHAIPGPGMQGNAVINGVYQGSYVVRSRHIVNLSQDAGAAYSKAKEIANTMGYELRANPNTMQEEMRDILRTNAETRERKEREEREREAIWEAERKSQEDKLRAQLEEGIFVSGPYRGKKFEEASRGYITWLVDTFPEFEDGSLIKLTAQLVKERCSALILPKPKKDLLVGEVGKRQVFEVTVLRCIPFEGFYGRIYFTTMVDKESGACILSKSGSFAANEGEELKFKATVKEHSDYKGQAQTVVQRISVQ